MKDKNLAITAVQSKDGIYFTVSDGDYGVYLYDGEKPKPTFHKKWGFIESIPKKITYMKSQPAINHRFELRDKSLTSDKIPETLDRETACYYDEKEYEWIWRDEWKQYYSLYKAVSDKQPPVDVEYEFTLDIIAKVDKVESPVEMGYTVQGTRYLNGKRQLTANDIHSPLLEKVIVPAILSPQRPCYLTSRETFDIVREHISENIDLSVAKITSDCNSCLTVKKRVKLAKIETFSVSVNRGRRTQYVQRTRTERLVECFEMTHNDDPYKGYTPIEGFTGKNHKDLKRKIDAYLKALMDHINTPFAECRHCGGDGVIITKAPERDSS